MFVTIYFENVLQFCGIWKKYCLRSLTLGAIGAKTWFFKMWPKSMHDQKFGTFYSLRPEDGLYGSNEPKKCEIRPVVSSIVHFKVFKSYFIYIDKPIPLFKEHVLLGNALDWQKFNWHKSHQQNGDRQMTHNHLKTHTLLFSFVSMSTPKLWLVPLASTLINHLLAKHPVLK